MADTKHRLDRALGLRSTFFVVTGSVIGSGIFLVASDIAQTVPHLGWGLSIWLVAGLISFVGALIFSELGTRFPNAGGQYVYLKEAFHPLLGFLFGWTLILVIQTGTIAAVSIAFAKFFQRSIALQISEQVLASIAIICLTALNCLGIRRGAKFLDGITAIKILAILALSFCGFFYPAPADSFPSSSALPSLTHYGVALIAAFWAFDGWNNLGFVAGEIKNPRRNIPLGLGFGILAITLLYLFTNITYAKILTLNEITASTFVAADVAQKVLGARGVALSALLVSLSALGCTNAMILGGARVIYAMAKDQKLPQSLARLNPKSHSPNFALWAQMIWALCLVWSGSYDQLFTYVVFAGFLFYSLCGMALFPLRRRDSSKAKDIYLAPFYPVLPALYALFCIVFAINALFEKPFESLSGLGIILLGIPAYLFFSRIVPSTSRPGKHYEMASPAARNDPET